MKNYPTFLLATFFFFTLSCRESVEPLSAPTNPPERDKGDRPVAFGRWPQSQLPLQLHISDEFDPEQRQVIEELARAWEESLEDQLQLFRPHVASLPTAEKTSLKDYRDDVIGIYPMNPWFTKLPKSTLGVTQFFGLRYNRGTPQEYISLIHADVFINLEHYKFRLPDEELPTSRFNGFDLATVVLHELGHLLGLPHTSFSQNSVMVPSIDAFDQNRRPKTLDGENLRLAYGISGRSLSKGPREQEAWGHKTPPDLVIGVIELNPTLLHRPSCSTHLYPLTGGRLVGGDSFFPQPTQNHRKHDNHR